MKQRLNGTDNPLAVDGTASNNSMSSSAASGKSKKRPHAPNAASTSSATSAIATTAAAPAVATSSLTSTMKSASASRYSAREKDGAASRSRVGGYRGVSAARDEAKKHMLEMRAELTGVVHVLDGGVNRTPVPLQRRQSLLGAVSHDVGRGGAGNRIESNLDLNGSSAMINEEMGVSFSHSSFMAGSINRSNMTRQSLFSTDRDDASSVISAGRGKHGAGGIDGSNRSLESSMQSLSFAGDKQMTDRSVSGQGSSMHMTSTGGHGSSSVVTQRTRANSHQPPRLVQQNTLLSEAVYVPPPPLNAEKKAAWRSGITTIVLSETPTIFLYTHQDEAVPNERPEEVAAVLAGNEAMAAAEEAFRVDEGTRFHSTGVATLRAPMKSIQTEVHPPARKDSGGLQVTTWMLKDAYATTLNSVADGEEEDNDEAQQRDDANNNEGGGGGDGQEVEEALQDGDEDGAIGGADGDEDSSDATRSTTASSEAMTATTHTTGGPKATSTAVEAGKRWMLSDTLLSTLRIMERAVVQNYVEAVQLDYRGISVEPSSRRTGGARGASGLPPALPASPNVAYAASPTGTVESVGADGEGTRHLNGHKSQANATGVASVGRDGRQRQLPAPRTGALVASGGTAAAVSGLTAAAPPVRLSESIRLLWRFGSPQLTRGRSVACMTWNMRELDMLAVGYTACRTTTAANTKNTSAKEVNAAIGSAAGGEDRFLSSPSNANDANNALSDKGDMHAEHEDGMLLTRSQGQDAHGMICCWSLKNPLAPELTLFLRHTADVTAMAFSREHPSLLAVGSSSGEIVVYDIRRDVVSPSITPVQGATAGQHTAAVWELQWMPKGKEQGEFLTSISADGRVVQWAVGKSIERVPPDLMHLQRQPGTQVEQAFVNGVAEVEATAAAATSESSPAGGKGEKKRTASRATAVGNGGTGKGGSSGAAAFAGGAVAEEAVLSRQCGGMCFDVCPEDTAVYVVGTEDGSVLQCSKSQTENYDFEYESHAELVYRVRWSPYSAAYFLTCSADWTSRLYKVNTSQAQLRFHSVRQDAVQDVAWSPTNALIFATVTAQGSAEVWSVMDAMCPRATVEFEDHRRLSTVLFAEQETPVLVVGDEKGDVTVFRLDGPAYCRQELTDDEQESWLSEAVRKQLT